MSKKKIMTKSNEVYEKLNLLRFTNQVVVNNVKKGHFENLVKNINSGIKVLDVQEGKKGNFTVKKVNPINYNLYRQRR